MKAKRDLCVKGLFITCFFACILWGGVVWADTLGAATGSGTATTTLDNTFETVTTTGTVSLTASDEVLVVATFSSTSSNVGGAARTARYQILPNTGGASTGNIGRVLSGTNDNGIGSMVYLFSGQANEASYSLQHKTETAGKSFQTHATIVALPLQTSGNVGLNNASKTVTTNFETASGSYTPVTGSETAAVALPTTGSFYVVASLNSTSSTRDTSGNWILQYKKGSGGTWTDLGNEAIRTMSSATSDIGAVSLCALLQNQAVEDYYFRVAVKSTVGATIGTNNVNLVAVALMAADASAVFSGFIKTGTAVTAATHPQTAISETNVRTTAAASMFLQAQYKISAAAATLSTYNLHVNTASAFDSLNQNRYVSGNTDIGSGSSVGLATGLVAGNTYTASLQHGTSVATNLTTVGYLLGFALTSDTPLAITLASFDAFWESDRVRLDWRTESELDNAGFHVWRSNTESGEYERISQELIPAEGSATWGADYAFEDGDVVMGRTYYYKIEDIDTGGVSTFHGPVSVLVGVADLKVNCSDDSQRVSSGVPVSLKATLQAAEFKGLPVEVWIAANTPFGWYSHANGWVPGIQAGGVMDLGDAGPVDFLNLPLPAGEYTFYLAIDEAINGVVDIRWLDSVGVVVE